MSSQAVGTDVRNAQRLEMALTSAIYRAETRYKTLKLSREHLDGKFFALNALPDSLPMSVQRVAAKLNEISAPER